MKFSIKKEILLENLNNVSKAVSTKNVIPVLGGIKFNLTNEGLFLTATNNDIDIECFIDKKYIDNIVSTGTIIIQGKYLLEIIRKLPDGLINIEIIDGLKKYSRSNIICNFYARIKTNTYRYQLKNRRK